MKRDTTIRNRHRAIVLGASDICWLCGHAGADAVDHKIPLAKGGTDTLDNKAPAHHNVACPECGERCNRRKGARIIPPTIRRSGSVAR